MKINRINTRLYSFFAPINGEKTLIEAKVMGKIGTKLYRSRKVEYYNANNYLPISAHNIPLEYREELKRVAYQ